MTQTEALRLALEYVELVPDDRYNADHIDRDALITTIKTTLEAKDEPVAWQYRDANDDGTWTAWNGCDKRLTESDWRKVRPLYTTPPQRTWVGLTDEEVADIERNSITRRQAIRAIEAKLKEKNT